MESVLARSQQYPLRRREVVARLLAERGELLVVTGLGAPSWDAAAAGDNPLTFPLWGAMGAAAMMGLGLALAQPKRRVLVITGDGEMLMGLGDSAKSVKSTDTANFAVTKAGLPRFSRRAGPVFWSAGGAGP